MIRNLQIRQRISPIPAGLIAHYNAIFGHHFLHEGLDTVEELLDRHLVKKEESQDDEEEELLNRQRLTNIR